MTFAQNKDTMTFSSGTRSGYDERIGYGYNFGSGYGYGSGGVWEFEIEIDTSSLPPGTYSVESIVAASGGSTSHDYKSSTASFTVKKASSGGGGDGGDDESTVDTPGTTVKTKGNVDIAVEDQDGTTLITVSGTTPGTSVNVQRSTGQIESDLRTRGAALDSMEVGFDGETDFDMQISNTLDKPDPSIPDPPSEKGAVGYINVDHSASDDAIGEVRFNFRVSQERLDARGIARDEVVLHRYSGGEWTTLETEYLGQADDGTPRFRAVSPGLSVFAIGSAPTQATATEEPTTEAPPETTEAPPETTEPPAATTEPVQEPGGFSGVSIMLVIAVVAIIVAGLWLYRERR